MRHCSIYRRHSIEPDQVDLVGFLRQRESKATEHICFVVSFVAIYLYSHKLNWSVVDQVGHLDRLLCPDLPPAFRIPRKGIRVVNFL